MNEEQRICYDLKTNEGLTRAQIAVRTGLSTHQVKRRLAAATRWIHADPALAEAAKRGGLDDVGNLSHMWKITKDKDGNGNSLFLKNHDTTDDGVSFESLVRDALEDYAPLDLALYAPRINTGVRGEHLLVVDLADIHFGKLSSTTETGTNYTVEVARHRTIEGTKALLNGAKVHGVDRIAFIMGNDILHTENGKGSTAGTPQDSDGNYFDSFKAAEHATVDAIRECATIADVDLIHCPSNHDWRMGWALSQTVAAHVSSHSGVRATDYNMSQQHRKYYGYGRNAIGLTHGDGAKEEKLYSLMVNEGRELILQGCDLYYWYCHHLHHKITKRRGMDVFQSEKDHTGNMTAITFGAPNIEGTNLKIDYVRSPSAPDGWHHRNGYVNRQGVEAFLHHAEDGQKHRLTEWF